METSSHLKSRQNVCKTKAYVDNERGGRERISFFDTSGLQLADDLAQMEWLRNYVYYADAIVLVFAVTEPSSFSLLEQLKRVVDRFREKKEVKLVLFLIPIFLLLHSKNASFHTLVIIHKVQFL